MDHEDELLARRRREKVLVISFGFLVVAGLLVAFTILTAGFLLYVLVVAGAVALFGVFHYLLWGWAMSEDVAGEREELEAQERAERELWDEDDPRRPRHW